MVHSPFRNTDLEYTLANGSPTLIYNKSTASEFYFSFPRGERSEKQGTRRSIHLHAVEIRRHKEGEVDVVAIPICSGYAT